MLVAISDQHFVDGTAGDHNLPYGAFRSVFLAHIAALAKDKKAKEIKLLLLGDLVDLIRSEQWFEEDPADRPWGETGLQDIEQERTESAVEKRCLKILGQMPDSGRKEDVPPNTILYKNWDTFAFFRNLQSLIKQEYGIDVPVEIIYVPGNHDRLCNQYPSIRDELQRLLGLSTHSDVITGNPSGEWWYKFDYLDEVYGIYARHGHQFDPWNYQNFNDHTRKGQLQIPIGDVFTTEFAVKIPWQICQMRDQYDCITDDLISSLKDMDNVRPMSQVMEWTYYRLKRVDSGEVRRVLDTAFDKVIHDLLDSEFVQQWRNPHTHMDELLRAMTSPYLRWLPKLVVDKLQAEDILPLFLSMSGGKTDPGQDPFVRAAYNEQIWRNNPRVQFVLYGHTHVPLEQPLDRHGNREVIYVNTGTWRERIFRTVWLDNAPDFVSMKKMTYCVFYREDEDLDGKEPGTISYDMWSGTKKKYYAA